MTDAWTVVSKKNKKRNRNRNNHNHNNSVKQCYNNNAILEKKDIETINNKIIKYKQELESNEFGARIKDALNIVFECLDDSDSNVDVHDIVAYGLGSFASNNAILQMAGLLFISDLLIEYFNKNKKNGNNDDYKLNIDVYDPVMNEIDSEIIKLFNCNPLSTNEECKRVANKSCIFYVPHGSLEMYGNLLNVNHTNKTLSNIILIGNSLSSYVINDALFYNGSQNDKNKSFISAIANNVLPSMVEYVLHRNKLASKVANNNLNTVHNDEKDDETSTSSSYKYIVDYEVSLDGNLERAFNDTSVHTFL